MLVLEAVAIPRALEAQPEVLVWDQEARGYEQRPGRARSPRGFAEEEAGEKRQAGASGFYRAAV